MATNTRMRDPSACLEYCQFMRKQHQLHATVNIDFNEVGRRIHNWASKPTSSLILMKGTFEAKHATKDLVTEIVELVYESKTAVIWALNGRSQDPTPTEVLKHMVFQLLQINSSLKTEGSLSMTVSSFQSARTEAEWFDILGLALNSIPRLFIVIDMEIFGLGRNNYSAWFFKFLELFSKLASRNSRTILKVVLATYKPYPQVLTSMSRLGGQSCELLIGKTGRRYQTASRRGGKWRYSHSVGPKLTSSLRGQWNC